MIFEIHNSEDNQFFLDVKASNGQIICHTETYTTKQNCKHAAEIIIAEASKATIVDKTFIPKLPTLNNM